MNSTQHKITDFQIWIEAHPERQIPGDSDFKAALWDLDQALSAAYLAAFDLDEPEA